MSVETPGIAAAAEQALTAPAPDHGGMSSALRRNLSSPWATAFVIFLTVLWTIPTLGLLVTSLRPAEGGDVEFDITVDDLHGGTKTVTVVINGANSAPTFTTPATATITDSSTGTAKITAVAVDPEGGPVTLSASVVVISV